jgi:predicted enzyme related to lactoylglutathione lyase
MLRRSFGGRVGDVELTGNCAFAWYELLTTDASAAREFYRRLFGWQARDASTSAFAYTVFSTDKAEIGGLMELPPEARRAGATPHWVGYVAVDDIDGAAARLKSLGGSILVPPTDSNIGRVSIVTDLQRATFGMVRGLAQAEEGDGEPLQAGRVGWHELYAADGRKSFAFYSALFGWELAARTNEQMDTYQLVSAGGRTIGGMFNKLERAPAPFWLYYFNVPDMDAALRDVAAAGGRLVHGPFQLVAGGWISRCVDPQGAMFALQAKGSASGMEAPEAGELAWSSRWGDFVSQGKVVKKPGAGD